MKNITGVAVLTLGTFVTIPADAQQQPVVVYAVDMEGEDGILDTVSVDWKICEFAINHRLHYRVVFIPVTNWPTKKYTFEDRKKIYKLLLDGRSIKLE